MESNLSRSPSPLPPSRSPSPPSSSDGGRRRRLSSYSPWEHRFRRGQSRTPSPWWRWSDRRRKSWRYDSKPSSRNKTWQPACLRDICAVEIAKLLEDNRFGNHAHAEQITSLPDECLSFVIGHLSSYNSRALLAIRAALCKTNRLHVSGVSLRDIYDCFFRQEHAVVYHVRHQGYACRQNGLPLNFEGRLKLCSEIERENLAVAESLGAKRSVPGMWDPSFLHDIFAERETWGHLIPPSQEEDDSFFKFHFCKSPPHHSDSLLTAMPYAKEFERRWDAFTEGQFDGWTDWDNMAVLGGAVFACLLDVPEEHAASPSTLRNYYHNVSFSRSDIDVIFYGLTRAQFKEKFLTLYRYLSQRTQGDLIVVKTPFTYTFCSTWPNRPIQIILYYWYNLEECLSMVDIDCAAVAYTGSKVLASPRALYSLYTRTILIRPANQFHPLYEARLVKYSRRGFWIADRGLKKSSLPLSDSVYSLARSTLLRENPGANRPQSFQIQGILLLLTVLRYPDVLKHLKIFKDDAKYKDEGLPYGPHWTTTKIKENLQEGNVRDLETYHWRADHACKLVDNPLEENIELTMKDSYRISDYFFIKNWYNSLAVVTDICGSENVEPAEFYVTQRKPPSYEVFELDDTTMANLL